MRSTVEGAVKHAHSKRDKNDPHYTPCVCCPGGNHIIYYDIMAGEDTPLRWVRKNMDTALPTGSLDEQRFINDFIRDVPEGTKVRITIEVIG